MKKVAPIKRFTARVVIYCRSENTDALFGDWLEDAILRDAPKLPGVRSVRVTIPHKKVVTPRRRR